MEKLLNYIWRNRLFPEEMITTKGESLEVLDTGIENCDAGPDFFNAKIKINSVVWAGNIELHTYTSDWKRHGHNDDNAYETVILHVVEVMDSSEIVKMNGEALPHLVLEIPQNIQNNYEYLVSLNRDVACLSQLYSLPPVFFTSWKDALLFERLERKSNAINELYKFYEGSWEEVFYVTLCRNFGFGLNSDSFEWLAKSLPYRVILKHCDSITDIEALLFGQAGYLDTEQTGEYACYLKGQYDFFKHKYQLKPLTNSLFKTFRVRPRSFPCIRLAQLARLLSHSRGLFSRMLETEHLSCLKELFVTSVSFFWKTHSTFYAEDSFSSRQIGTASLNILIINTVIPVTFAYYRALGDDRKKESVISLLEELPGESNYITRMFERGGIPCSSAFDSQALIQLKKEYCDKKRCLRCRIGQKLLQQG